jgi:N6-adenosine-specific RNA methylase IME4
MGELSRLEVLERVIDQHLAGFIIVGRALAEVREERLWEATHESFEEWARGRFDISQSYAHRLIDAARISDAFDERGMEPPRAEYLVRPLARFGADEQAAIWEQATALAISTGEELGEKHVRAVVREKKRQERLEKLAATVTNEPPNLATVGVFPVILADPPWRYNSATADPSRQIENQYPTMSLDEIKALEVGKMAADDAVLFLWATSPLLIEALAVMAAWGFEYKSHLIWDKVKIGMGYWVRGRHELLLIGTRGTPPKPAPGDRAPSILVSPRGKHSAKPVESYELIEDYYPELPKVELFSRAPRPGWTAWGNEVTE